MCVLCIHFKELNRHLIVFYLYRYRQIPISESELGLEIGIGIGNRDEIGNGVLLSAPNCQISSRGAPLLCTQLNCLTVCIVSPYIPTLALDRREC